MEYARLTVLPLPRGESWSEEDFILSPHFVDPVTPTLQNSKTPLLFSATRKEF
jgi:hypothetical protein